MATITWTGNAAAVRQRDTITVANTWATNDYVILTINGKDLTVTIGSDTTTAQVATAIRDAWNASSRLDSEGATDATSNFGGQEFGEFAEVTASIDPDATSVVILTANTPGKPFTLSVSETTAGDGTATEATAQAATGPNYWNNADNWDGNGGGGSGSAPINDDVCVFRDNDVSVKYGLPNGSLEVTIQQYQSYTGMIGLPAINRDNAGKPYTEYRQRYVRLDDSGTSVTDIPHRFGIGQTGNGSPLINLKHSTIKITPVVFNTGTPQIPGTKALNICGATNTSTLSILNGSVDFSTQDGTASLFATVSQTGGDSRGINGLHATASVVTCHGGTMMIGGATSGITATVRGGTLRAENQTGTFTALNVYGGTVDYAATATITNLKVTAGGTFDARSDVGAFTITAGSLFDGSRFFDPFSRATASSNFFLYREPSADLLFGGSASAGVQVVL